MRSSCFQRISQQISFQAPRATRLATLANRAAFRASQHSNLPASLPVFEDATSALKQTFGSFDTKTSEYRPLIVVDVGVVERQYHRWARNLPRIRPYYAVKCNPDELFVQTLAACGTGFDCATSAEIKLVLAKGVKPEDIIFANPIKNMTDIAFAKSVGVRKMTFDNEDELRKIHSVFPEAQLVLRLLPDDSGSLMRFGSKFGASSDNASALLEMSKQLNLSVIGVSFHIGSGCFKPSKYKEAIAMCRGVFDVAEKLGLPKMTMLDVGGGFPGDPVPFQTGRDGTPAFEKFAEVIVTSIAESFPAEQFPHLECIGEPGRYFATAAGTLFTMVQGKRAEPAAGKALYYINDGVYGSFNNIMFDHAKPSPITLENFFPEEHEVEVYRRPSKQSSGLSSYMLQDHVEQDHNGGKKMMAAKGMASTAPKQLAATIFGPTCDSMDRICDGHMMRELSVGDWLVFDHMGAYTTAAGTEFNGCKRPVMKHVYSKDA